MQVAAIQFLSQLAQGHPDYPGDFCDKCDAALVEEQYYEEYREQVYQEQKAARIAAREAEWAEWREQRRAERLASQEKADLERYEWAAQAALEKEEAFWQQLRRYS